MLLKKLLYMGWIAGLLVALAGPGAAPAVQADDSVGRLTVDGVTRTFYLYVPSSYDESLPAPLVVALHPLASSGRAMAALTGLDTMAETQGMIVVYPDSTDFAWADGRDVTGWSPTVEPVDDVAYITALIDHLSETYAIDPARVYLAGYANGGLMAFRLACQMPERFARTMVVGALMYEYHLDVCPAVLAEPEPMLIVHGTDDAHYWPEGRVVDSSGDNPDVHQLSAKQTVSFWLERNGCDEDQVQIAIDSGAEVYGACDGGAAVAFYPLEGVGNNWPRAGDYVLNQFGLDLTEVAGRYFSTDLATPDDWFALVSQPPDLSNLYLNTPRTYLVYVPPSYDPEQPIPLVIALHGRPGTGGGIAYLYDMNWVARENGFVVVYPDGIENAWNYTRGVPNFWDPHVDDTEFFRLLVDDLARDLSIDFDRLYVTGFSNGGFMTQRVACEDPERYAAFAEGGSGMFPYFEQLCEDQPPVPMLVMHGTKDRSIPWNGIVQDGVVLSWSVPDTAIFWAMHDQCDPKQTDYSIIPSKSDEPTTLVYRYVFQGCAPGTEVLYYVIEGGGHNLPGTVDRLSADIADEVNMDIHAGQEIWTFFSQHSLADRR